MSQPFFFVSATPHAVTTVLFQGELAKQNFYKLLARKGQRKAVGNG